MTKNKPFLTNSVKNQKKQKKTGVLCMLHSTPVYSLWLLPGLFLLGSSIQFVHFLNQIVAA